MSIDVVTGNVVLDDEKLSELQHQLNIYHNHAIGYHEGELGVRVRMGWEYYYGRLPAPITASSSKQVNPVVWNSVNGVLGELQSAFTAGDEVVRFTPLGPEDGVAANIATKLVNKVLLHDNDGFNALSDAFKECLVARNGFIKRYWGKTKKVLIEEFEDLSKEELDVYLANIDGDILELFTEETKSIEIDEKGVEKEVKKLKNEKPTPKGQEKFQGRVIYEKTTEGVKVEYVPFEEVIVEPTARSICDANFIAHRVRKTKHELKIMGFDPEIVDALPVTSSDIEAGVIANSRVNNLSPLNVSDTILTGDNETDKLWLHENYIKSSVLGRDELLQVFTVHNQIIDVNVVNEIPFSTFTPFPIPGSLWGESVYDVTKDLQDLGTNALRLIIDNGINANFRRYIAVKGAYDRQSLMNNRPGSVIEAQDVNAVQPFPHHPLPQGVELLFQYVDQEKEERTGVNKAGQGLDPAVFKNDNSTATVQMVMTAALNRVRMVARNIAHGGMTDLMLGIYNLIRMNGKEPILVETAQGMTQVDPRTLPPRSKLTVAVAIGPAEKAERAQKLQTVLMAMTQVPQMGAFLQANNAYYLATQILESMGIMDISNYLTPPDQLPPPQPSPQEQMQLQLMQEQVKQAGVTTQKMVSDVNLNQSKHEFEQMKAADEMTIRKQESASSQDRMADEHMLNSQKLQLEQRRLDIEDRKLNLKAQEMMIEAQMEAKQSRPVAIGRT